MTEEELYDLSDEELEAAFKDAKTEAGSPEDGLAGTEVEEDNDELDLEQDQDENEVDELEQPEQDSDDDTSDDDEDEEDTDDDSETEEDDLDGDSETEDEQTEPVDDKSKEPAQPVQDEKVTFKANGQEYTFTNDEMKSQFGKVFGQAMDYTKKMQQIKPYRKTIDAIESAGLGQNDVSLMIDVLKGDKDAIANVLKRTGVDALDLDTENSNYVAKDYGRSDTELNIKDIIDDISGDKEYATTHTVLEKQWDDSSRDEFVKNPELIKLLHTDVKSGMFDNVNPIAQKLKVYDGASKSDLEYYKMAAQQYFDGQARDEAVTAAQDETRRVTEERSAEAKRIAEVKASNAKQRATKAASQKRKAAAPTGKKAAGTNKSIDYLDDSDEAFEEWYNSIQDL